MKEKRVQEAAGGLVTSDPEVLGGKPVFRGTRVPAAILFEYLADGLSIDYFQYRASFQQLGFIVSLRQVCPSCESGSVQN